MGSGGVALLDQLVRPEPAKGDFFHALWVPETGMGDYMEKTVHF